MSRNTDLFQFLYPPCVHPRWTAVARFLQSVYDMVGRAVLQVKTSRLSVQGKRKPVLSLPDSAEPGMENFCKFSPPLLSYVQWTSGHNCQNGFSASKWNESDLTCLHANRYPAQQHLLSGEGGEPVAIGQSVAPRRLAAGARVSSSRSDISSPQTVL